MRTEKNPLDLNNFPEDCSSKQVFDESSSTGGGGGGGHGRKKKNGANNNNNNNNKDECGKVYECRFCSLKFCKSQALGGHMNRHRQERETETLNKARQLVFQHNDNLATQPPPGPHHHLGCHPITPGSYHHHPAAAAGHIGDAFRMSATYPPPRLFSSGGSSSSTLVSPPPQPSVQQYPYPSLTGATLTSAYSSHSHPPLYHPSPPHPAVNELYVGHILSSSPHSQYPHLHHPSIDSTNYTCIGAPVGGHGFVSGSNRGPDLVSGPGSSSTTGNTGRDGSSLISNSIQEAEVLNWGRSYTAPGAGAGAGAGAGGF